MKIVENIICPECKRVLNDGELDILDMFVRAGKNDFVHRCAKCGERFRIKVFVTTTPYEGENNEKSNAPRKQRNAHTK